MLVDFGKKQVRNYTPLTIDGTPVERVDTLICVLLGSEADLSTSSTCQLETKQYTFACL